MTGKLRAGGQLTIPKDIRKAAHLEEGDPVVFELTEEGILLRPQKVIDSTQAWFWSPRWQVMEAEAEADIRAGRTEVFNTTDDFLLALKTRSQE
jgi:AbrB family looped-hinge helix DNA binding protein